jgi:hypothetical protein
MSEKGAVQKTITDSKPPGVLNADQIGRFKTIQEDTAELPIKTIQPCPLIPDYRDPTESTLPIVVQSPVGNFCIDGWRSIEQGIAEGQPVMRCFVIQIQEHSDTELAIRKVEVRTKPRGGTCLFAESVRNTSILAKILMDEIENPIVFSHGGARRGGNFSNNKEDDLRQVLSERLGKSRGTINDYLHFSLHLTDDAKDVLVAQKASKAFFEKARINKRKLITILESDGLIHEDITTEVSGKMLEWLGEYQRTGKIQTDYGETEPPEEGTENENQGDETTDDESGTSTEDFETFHHRSPIVENAVPELPTDETVRTAIQAVIEALAEILGQPSIDCEQAIEIISKQIDQLADVRQVLIDLCSRAQRNQDEEVS